MHESLTQDGKAALYADEDVQENLEVHCGLAVLFLSFTIARTF